MVYDCIDHIFKEDLVRCFDSVTLIKLDELVDKPISLITYEGSLIPQAEPAEIATLSANSCKVFSLFPSANSL